MNFKVRHVYLEDLPKIVKIYKISMLEGSKFKTSNLKSYDFYSTFGIPVLLLVFDDKISGFASLTLDILKNRTTSNFYDKNFDNDEMKRKLNEAMQKIIPNRFKDDPENLRLKTTSNQWKFWLNDLEKQ